MKKINKMKSTASILIMLTFLGCMSVERNKSNYKEYESQQLQCGQEKIKVVSSCYDPDEGLEDRGSGGIIRQCKSSKLLIGNTANIELPVVAESQKKIYSRKLLEEGVLSLVSFSCVRNNSGAYILLNQGVSNNINAMSLEDFLLFNDPVLLNSKGVLISGRVKKDILKNPNNKKSKTLSANAVYGVN